MSRVERRENLAGGVGFGRRLMSIFWIDEGFTKNTENNYKTEKIVIQAFKRLATLPK